jgi:hypothetical protein
MISFHNNADGTRVADATCVMCKAKFDAVTQVRDAAGEWSPDVQKIFTMSGWLARGDSAYCGRFCSDRHAYAMRGATQATASDIRQPVAVTKPIIASPVRKAMPAPQAQKR